MERLTREVEMEERGIREGLSEKQGAEAGEGLLYRSRKHVDLEMGSKAKHRQLQ